MLERGEWVTCDDAEQPASKIETNRNENLSYCVCDICMLSHLVIRRGSR